MLGWDESYDCGDCGYNCDHCKCHDSKIKVAALFIENSGVYCDIPWVDPWDEERDARFYGGPWPVVAHPPCARWSTLAYVVEAQGGKAVAEDGGLFASALVSVERFGGILEHPANSVAWKAFGIAKPDQGFWTRTRKGWTTQVSQAAYGHVARKLTWLYYVGKEPPKLDWSIPHAIQKVTSKGGIKTGEMKKSLRSRTPIPFRDALLQIALSCK